MRHRFFTTTFTPSVQAEQAKHGSHASYARLSATVDGVDPEGLSLAEIDFISARDSFYLGTVSETGWPHVQHRGGPVGFVHIVDPFTLAWADFSGNRQYVSIGNTAVNAHFATRHCLCSLALATSPAILLACLDSSVGWVGRSWRGGVRVRVFVILIAAVVRQRSAR